MSAEVTAEFLPGGRVRFEMDVEQAHALALGAWNSACNDGDADEEALADRFFRLACGE